MPARGYEFYLRVFNTLMITFLTIFRIFPKILQKMSEGQTNVSEHFPKMPEDNRRFPRKNRCFGHTATNLRDYVTIAMGIFSLVKIACYFTGNQCHSITISTKGNLVVLFLTVLFLNERDVFVQK